MKTPNNGQENKPDRAIQQAARKAMRILARHWRFGLPPDEHKRDVAESAEELRAWLFQYSYLEGREAGFDFLLNSNRHVLETFQGMLEEWENQEREGDGPRN